MDYNKKYALIVSQHKRLQKQYSDLSKQREIYIDKYINPIEDKMNNIEDNIKELENYLKNDLQIKK